MIICLAVSQTTSWNPESFARNACFVSDLGGLFLGLLEAKPKELILDLSARNFYRKFKVSSPTIFVTWTAIGSPTMFGFGSRSAN